MSDFVISGSILKELKITSADLMIDLAVYLYDKEKLSLGQAKKIAGLTQLEFQKEMSKRNVEIKFDIQDLEKDLFSLNQMT